LPLRYLIGFYESFIKLSALQLKLPLCNH